MAGTRWTDRLGRLCGAVYDAAVEREWLARPAGRLLWGTDTRLLYAAIRAIGELPDGSAVLDVPCGGGVALRGLRPGLRYVGADVAPGMLARARRASARCGVEVELVAADAARLSLAGDEFDLCVSFNGLHCLPDPAAAVRELARCVQRRARRGLHARARCGQALGPRIRRAAPRGPVRARRHRRGPGAVVHRCRAGRRADVLRRGRVLHRADGLMFAFRWNTLSGS
jgi:SAM-dependent methyltransferase